MSSYQKYFRRDVTRRKAYTLKVYPRAIKLNQNELPYDMPQGFKRELFQRLKKIPFQIYPQPQPERLRKKLAKILGISPDQLLISNGSNVMIQNLVMAAAVKGKVMSLEPGFTLFESEAKILGNRYIPIRLKAPKFKFPLETFLKTMQRERPQIIFIANPHAPTGTLFPKEDLLEVIRRAKCPVVIDEAYYNFSKETLLPKIKQFPHLILLQTFSKGFGMGGIRVGYMVGRKQMVDEVKKAMLPYCVPVLSEETALVALNHRDHFDKIAREVLKERERVFQALNKMKNVEPFPSHANFILFRVKNAKACFQYLLKKGVLIRDMSAKPGLKGCLRVSIGKRRDNEAFLRAMKSYK